MKNIHLVCSTLLFLLTSSNLTAQIVQPGQLEVIVYPGSQIKEEYLIGDMSNEPDIDALLFDDKTVGTLCVNRNACYENVIYNVDLQSKMLIMDVEGEDKYLSWNFIYSLSSISNSRNYKIFLDPTDNQKYFAELLFSNDSTAFYKKYYLITIKPNYRPEFDTGTKVLTIEVRDQYVFIDESRNYAEFKKISKGQLKRNLPEGSQIFEYIKEENPSIRTEADFVQILERVY